MGNSNKIRTELRFGDALLHITLDAPKANVLDGEMLASIHQAVERGAHVPHLRAIAFEGEGKHFSFGASVEEHRVDQVAGMLRQFHDLFRALCHAAVPTIAIVRGQCLGGGLELASWCSWVFADHTARFGQPEIRLGVFPPMASVLLPWRIGGGAAVDLCVSGRSIDAERARDIGLVVGVSDDARAAADAFFGEHLVGLSASSVRFAERAARMDLIERLTHRMPELERMYVEELMTTHDAVEGIEAFLDKRQPRYEHR